jgi:hypothetical protein
MLNPQSLPILFGARLQDLRKIRVAPSPILSLLEENDCGIGIVDIGAGRSFLNFVVTG